MVTVVRESECLPGLEQNKPTLSFTKADEGAPKISKTSLLGG
jgi:hypothetical protein